MDGIGKHYLNEVTQAHKDKHYMLFSYGNPSLKPLHVHIQVRVNMDKGQGSRKGLRRVWGKQDSNMGSGMLGRKSQRERERGGAWDPAERSKCAYRVSPRSEGTGSNTV